MDEWNDTMSEICSKSWGLKGEGIDEVYLKQDWPWAANYWGWVMGTLKYIKLLSQLSSLFKFSKWKT